MFISIAFFFPVAIKLEEIVVLSCCSKLIKGPIHVRLRWLSAFEHFSVDLGSNGYG